MRASLNVFTRSFSGALDLATSNTQTQMRNFNTKIRTISKSATPMGAQQKANHQPAPEDRTKKCNAKGALGDDFSNAPDGEFAPLNLQQRGLQMFQEMKFSDCEFRLTDDESAITHFKAHRAVLIYASDVFRSMFLGQFPKEEVVIIKDIKPKIFHFLLRFAYTMDVAEEEICFEDLLELAVAANKYLMSNLQKVCIDIARKRLTPIKVFAAEYVADLLGENKLAEDCLKIIKTSAASALLSKCFLSISKERLLSLLDSDRLNISSEMSLVNACIRWANFNHAQNVDATLRSFLPKLRLLTLSPQEFSANIDSFSWLTDAEKVAVFVNITSRRDSKIEMPSEFCRNEDKRNI